MKVLPIQNINTQKTKTDTNTLELNDSKLPSSFGKCCWRWPGDIRKVPGMCHESSKISRQQTANIEKFPGHVQDMFPGIARNL